MSLVLIGFVWGVISGIVVAIVFLRSQAAVKAVPQSGSKRALLAALSGGLLTLSFGALYWMRDNFPGLGRETEPALSWWHLGGLLVVMIPTFVRWARDEGWFGS